MKKDKSKLKEEMSCDYCAEKFEELVGRHNFYRDHGVEWVCEDCFEQIEGVVFDVYKEKGDFDE